MLANPDLATNSNKYMATQKGFTLVELLVVISIMAILAVIGSTVFSGVQKGARDAKRKADINAIAKAYEVKYSNTGSYEQPLQGSDFTGGVIPQKPEGGSYDVSLNADKLGFQVCVAVEGDATPYCRQSLQGIYTPPPTPTPTSTSTPTPSPLPLGTYIANSTDGNIVAAEWTTKSRDIDWVLVFGSGATQINYLESFSGRAIKALVYSTADTVTAGQIMDQINNTSGNSIHSVMANIESGYTDVADLASRAKLQYDYSRFSTTPPFDHFIFAPMGWVLRASNNYQLLADGTTGDIILFQTQGYQPNAGTYANIVRTVVGNIKSLPNPPKVFVQLAVSYKLPAATPTPTPTPTPTFQCFSASTVEGFINDLKSGPANTVPDGFVIFYFLSGDNATNADAQCQSDGLPIQPDIVKSIIQNYLP